MRWFKLTVAYDGGPFIGWQRQAADCGQSVQGVLEDSLQNILGAKERIPVLGAGRTDAGVHAYGQVASFATERSIPTAALPSALNRMLPVSIRVRVVEEFSHPFHACYDCKRKTYRYTIACGNEDNPFFAQYAYYIPQKPDLAAMRQAARELVGRHNFKSFTANNHRSIAERQGYDYERSIFSCDVIPFAAQDDFFAWRKLPEALVIEITGEGFLYKMVRIMSSFLLDVGCGKRSLAELPLLLTGKVDKVANPLPPQGLILWRADY